MVDKLFNVISKVKKLLNVVNGSDKPGEVAAAQALAQSLITKYQIEEAQLLGHVGEGGVIERKIPNPKPYAIDKSVLLNSIAKHNFCKVLRGDGYCMIYGYESDIELCLTLYDILLPHMVNEMIIKLEKFKAIEDVHPKTWSKSFFSGYCVNIASRIKESKQQVIDESEIIGTSIEVILRDKQHALEDYFQQLNYKPATERNISSELGYKEGINSSNKINLNQNDIIE